MPFSVARSFTNQTLATLAMIAEISRNVPGVVGPSGGASTDTTIVDHGNT